MARAAVAVDQDHQVRCEGLVERGGCSWNGWLGDVLRESEEGVAMRTDFSVGQRECAAMKRTDVGGEKREAIGRRGERCEGQVGKREERVKGEVHEVRGVEIDAHGGQGSGRKGRGTRGEG